MDPLDQMRALKQVLETASGHLTKTAGMEGVDTFSTFLNAFTAKLTDKIKVAEPAPKTPEPHVLSLRLQVKIRRQTKIVQQCKEELLEARAKLEKCTQRYNSAEDRLGASRAAFNALGAHLPDIPSPLISDADSSADEDTDEDEEMDTDEDLGLTPREESISKRRREDRVRRTHQQSSDRSVAMISSQGSSLA